MMQTFPGGSKKRVNLAGDRVRSETATFQDLRAIDDWRAAHRAVLNTFQAILRTRTRHTNISVAQRHKRRRTIFDKLRRFPNMNLVRMDDVAGCRLIFQSIDDLYTFRKEFHKARFNHKRRNDLDKYDYIKHPKLTGYRGVHDVYEYDVNSITNRHLTGLYMEVQYRTLVQHAWATAVEVIGFITESQPKFEQGDERYQRAMVLTSEILARAFENNVGAEPTMTNDDVVQEFLALDAQLHLMRTLRGLNATNKTYTEKKNAILIFSETDELEILEFRDATDALRRLFDLEKQHPERDIVLVRADTSEDVRLAFKNYFSDARDFIRLVEQGCNRLTQKRKASRRVIGARPVQHSSRNP